MYRKRMSEALQEARAYRDPVNEDRGFSSQQIKMAYGVLNDPRYKQGNYSGAVRAIEKIARGLSNHPDVANALKRANEELEEGAMKRVVQGIHDKLSKEGGAAGFDDLKKTAKSMGVDLTPAMLKDMPGVKQHRDGDYILEEIELDESLDVRYDTKKQGWFDRQGKRRYLGKMATNALMKKAIDKAIRTGDFINPFKLKHGQKPEETIKEFKKMVVTIADPMKRTKAMDDIKRFGKRTGFRIDKMSDGKSFRIDGQGADLNKFATDLKNFYGAEIKAESVEELQEAFTKADFAKLEADNEHTEAAEKLINMFGTKEEKFAMAAIKARHNMTGYIKGPDYNKRQMMVNKYYSRLK